MFYTWLHSRLPPVLWEVKEVFKSSSADCRVQRPTLTHTARKRQSKMCRTLPGGRKCIQNNWIGDNHHKILQMKFTVAGEIISSDISKSTSMMKGDISYYSRSASPIKPRVEVDSYLEMSAWFRITVEVHCWLFLAEEILKKFWNCLQKLRTRPTVEDAAIFAKALPTNYPSCTSKLWIWFFSQDDFLQFVYILKINIIIVWIL